MTPQQPSKTRTAAQVCVGECDHLPHGACRECVEQALTDYAKQQVNEDRNNPAAFRAHEAKARAEALEEAAKAVEDEISGKVLHAEGLPEYIRALGGKRDNSL